MGDADPGDIALSGIAKAQIFLVLFFAIQWLQTPASVSPALHAVRRTVVSQPPGRRFLYLAASGHILGSVLNVAGLVLLSTMVERQKDALLQRRMASALMQNYIVASTWSPFFIGVVVILIALPELSWLDVVTGGLPMALIAVGVSWLHDRIRYRPQGVGRRPFPIRAPGGATWSELDLRLCNFDCLGYWYGGMERFEPSRSSWFCRPAFWDDLDGFDRGTNSAALAQRFGGWSGAFMAVSKDCAAKHWPLRPRVSLASDLPRVSLWMRSFLSPVRAVGSSSG